MRGAYQKLNLSRAGKSKGKNKNKGWRYRRGIPTDLRAIFAPKREWSTYLGDISTRDAEISARELTVRDDKRIALLRSLPPDERALVVESGALDDPEKLERHARALDASARFVGAVAVHTNVDEGDSEAEQGEHALVLHRAGSDATGIRKKAERARKTARKIVGGSLVDALLDTWRRQTNPRGAETVKKYRLFLTRFAQTIGDMAPRDVKPEHVRMWRDALEKTYTTTNTAKHLEGLNAMFRAARSAGVVDTVPSDGIRPTRREATKFVDATRKLPFRPEHVRAIFKALPGTSADFQWCTKLLAYHGARSGEIAQLRVEDVTTVANIPVLSIHDRHGSVKNKHSVRDVPIHPACIGIVDYARARNGEWLFGSFLEWKGKRGEYYQRLAHDFLRDTVGIKERDYTMHSFRHLWRQMARELSMPAGISRAIMGHKLGNDVHEEYGGAPPLRARAEWIARIDPLG